MKKLSELYDIDSDILIEDIKINSKECHPGSIFVCTNGVTADRHDFVDDAIKNGASAIVASRRINASVPVVYVDDTNKELTLLAKKFYDYPEKELSIIGVTGTNGKTTVTSIIQDLLGYDKCGYMGTNGIRCSKFDESIRNTTPDADRLYMYFRRFRDSNCRYLSMEVSSESLYRERLWGVNYDVAIFVNITEDHLNIHKTVENYVESKLKLLDLVNDNGITILNRDDKYYDLECSRAKSKVVSFGYNEDSTLRIVSCKTIDSGTEIKYLYNGVEYNIKSPLYGEFNVYNLSAAILAIFYYGYDFNYILDNISKIRKLKGRVEFIDFGQDYKIILDYAHTTDAFLKLYKLLNEIKKTRIITLTGSAGGREKEKRFSMGKVVSDNSDIVIFTMDDPREESVIDIIHDLERDCTKDNYIEIEDRVEAIHKAFDIAKKDDIVLIAGKGRDDYMAIGKEYLPYNDYDEIVKYFNEKK